MPSKNQTHDLRVKLYRRVLCRCPKGQEKVKCLMMKLLPTELIEARLGAIEELLSKPEIFSGLQSTLSRFFDIDQLLSLCAVVPRENVTCCYFLFFFHLVVLEMHLLEAKILMTLSLFSERE